MKTLFLREGKGIIRELLFGGRVVAFLATEQPQIFNHRAGLVVRTEDGLLQHVRVHKQHIIQRVLYLGREPSMEFRFEIGNLRELDSELRRLA